MYKLYITSLFIVSLSVFHQIESSNVTLKSFVNDFEGNSYKSGDDISLKCESHDTKVGLVSLKILHDTAIIYDYNEIKKHATTTNIDGAANVTGDVFKDNKEVSIKIHKVTKDIGGNFQCVLEYNNTNQEKSDSITIPYYPNGLKDCKFDIYSDKEVKDFKKGQTLSISCKPDPTDPVVLIELEHGNEKIFTYHDKGNHTKHNTKDIPDKDITYKENSTVEIDIKDINDKMGGVYKCVVTYKLGNVQHIDSKEHDIHAVKGIGSILNISYVLILISLICTRFSYSL